MKPKTTIREKIVLLGKDYIISEKTHVEEFSTGAIGISIGPKQRHWHLELNEDAGIVLRFADRIVVAVCDGHHGASASEIVINTIQKSSSQFLECETQNQFNVIIESILIESYQIILDLKSSDSFSFPRTATTVSIALITDSSIFWANMGDSALIIQNGVQKPKMLNKLHSQAFVGWTPPTLRGFSVEDNIIKLLQKGNISKKNVSRLILTTDGILDYYPGGLVPLFKALPRLCNESPCYAIHHIFQNVIDKGMGDNLCAAIIDLDS